MLKKFDARNNRHLTAKKGCFSRDGFVIAKGLVGCSTCFNFLKIPAANKVDAGQTETAGKA